MHEVEERLKQVEHPATAVAMLTMRRNEKVFLARLGPAYAEKRGLAAFETGLARAHVDGATKAAIAERMQRDQASLAEMAAASRLSRESEQLRAQVDQFLAEVKAV